MSDAVLNDVSDTALWVAVYRARETARPDALFRDPLASRLAGDRGTNIEKQMSDSNYVAWSVVLRTWIIDAYLEKLIAEGADTVINLGAGLDTRPYRLKLPRSLRWIEIDFPRIIALKEERLDRETPVCRLERIALDLSRADERRRIFTQINAETKKAVVITEGVTPYLSNDDVAALATELRRQANFKYWINEYNSPELMKYVNRPSRRKQMRNAPLLFLPPDWSDFYAQLGWRSRELRYIGEESEKIGRPAPHNWWVKFVRAVFLSPRRGQNSIALTVTPFSNQADHVTVSRWRRARRQTSWRTAFTFLRDQFRRRCSRSGTSDHSADSARPRTA